VGIGRGARPPGAGPGGPHAWAAAFAREPTPARALKELP
jgi:hypothetical protein